MQKKSVGFSTLRQSDVDSGQPVMLDLGNISGDIVISYSELLIYCVTNCLLC
jgi:hypothetical protein